MRFSGNPGFTDSNYIKNLIRAFEAMLKIIKVLLNEHAFIGNRDSDLFFHDTLKFGIGKCHNN